VRGAAVGTGTGTGTGTGIGSGPEPAAGRCGGEPLSDLVALAAQRIGTGDVVAAAKFGTPQAIDDPAREKQELDAVAAESPGLGSTNRREHPVLP